MPPLYSSVILTSLLVRVYKVNLKLDCKFFGFQIFVRPTDCFLRQQNGIDIVHFKSSLPHRSPDVPWLKGPRMISAHDDREAQPSQSGNGLVQQNLTLQFS